MLVIDQESFDYIIYNEKKVFLLSGKKKVEIINVKYTRELYEEFLVLSSLKQTHGSYFLKTEYYTL